jgi:nucleoside-diphosphate-sugar epimerase
MRVTFIGGTGHIGSYLVPRLVGSGHQVTVISRGTTQPYFPDDRWSQVNRVFADLEAGERDGSWAQLIRRLETDAIIDLTCFKLESARCLVEALAGNRSPYLLHCGTIRVYGCMAEVTAEEAPRAPIEPYGREKAAIEEYLSTLAQKDGFPAVVLHPGHIVGKGRHGGPLILKAISTRRFSQSSRPVRKSPFPTMVSPRCITSMPTMWPKPSSSLWKSPPPAPAKPSRSPRHKR